MIVLSYALATKNIFLTLIKTAIQCEFESEKEGQNLCETACSVSQNFWHFYSFMNQIHHLGPSLIRRLKWFC